MADIFISYAHADKAWAQALAAELAGHGWSVWWDRDIPTGREFRDVIEEELTAAKCVLVLWSRESVESEFVRSEASRAQKRRVMVPVLIDDATIPLGLDEIQTASLLGWEPGSMTPELERLIAHIGAILKQPAVAPERSRLPMRFWINIALLLVAALVAGAWLVLAVRPQVSRVVFGVAALAAAALFAFGLFEIFKRKHSRRLTWVLAAAIPVFGMAHFATPAPVQLIRVAPGTNLTNFNSKARQGLVLLLLRNGKPVARRPFSKFETIYLAPSTAADAQNEIKKHNGDEEHRRQLRAYLSKPKVKEADIRTMINRYIVNTAFWRTPELRKTDQVELVLQSQSGKTLLKRAVERRPGVVVPTVFIERPEI
ncbi:MAG TPA: toll/interleukin-1 receptor domain-containing protein [Thermoanaerobaculia bacterium]|nr:toll/interleukin-1 receptor domain-containing protein [Thermoanaerobaculia bacterium]